MGLNILSNKKDGGVLSQYLAVLSANILTFMAGIHAGWPSPSLKKLMSDEYPFKITENEGSYIAIISYVGDIIGGISGSFLIDKIGRKNALLGISLPFFASFFFISLLNYSPVFLYIARIFGGLGEGAVYALIPIYVAEVTHPDIRGKLGVFQLMIAYGGELFVNVISEFVSIQNVALICLALPVTFIFIFWHMPETPYYLLSKDRKVDAMKSLRFLRRTSKVEKELDVMENDVQRQMSEEGGFRELFIIPANRKAFILANFTRLFQQTTGCTAYDTYYQIMIGNATNIPPIVGTAILLIMQITLPLVSYNFIDRYGRKSLLILSATSTSAVLFTLGCFMAIRDFTNIDTSSLNIFPLVMMVLFVISFIIGFGAVTNILTAEMYSSSIKSKATAFSSVNMSLMMIGTVKYYQFTADNISMAVPFLTYSFSSFISIFFFYKCLIETKGKTLEMIQMELMGLSKS